MRTRRAAVVEPCAVCGKEIEPGRHRYHRDWRQLLEGSVAQRRSAREHFEDGFTVRCPECGCTYVSHIVRGTFGFNYGQGLALLAGLCACVLLVCLASLVGLIKF